MQEVRFDQAQAVEIEHIFSDVQQVRCDAQSCRDVLAGSFTRLRGPFLLRVRGLADTDARGDLDLERSRCLREAPTALPSRGVRRIRLELR